MLLLAWTVFFNFSLYTLIKIHTYILPHLFTTISMLVSRLLAPLIGWLADVKFGRYEMIKSGSLFSFMASILVFFGLVTEGTLCKLLVSIALAIVSLSSTFVSAAMLPFLTDQLIGATADQLSTVVYWYYWADKFGLASSDTIYFMLGYLPNNAIINNDVYLSCIMAVPLALIIISDCLCLQWLDRTHKVTNPIKLIIQVLNYTRKHRYPERRSAFTYLDEEHPSRMDFGKEKFGRWTLHRGRGGGR